MPSLLLKPVDDLWMSKLMFSWGVGLKEKERILMSCRGHQYFTSAWGQIKFHCFFLWQFAHLLEGDVWVMVLTLKLAHLIFCVALTVSWNGFTFSTCVCLKSSLRNICVYFTFTKKCLVLKSYVLTKLCEVHEKKLTWSCKILGVKQWSKFILLNSLTVNCRWRHVL